MVLWGLMGLTMAMYERYRMQVGGAGAFDLCLCLCELSLCEPGPPIFVCVSVSTFYAIVQVSYWGPG